MGPERIPVGDASLRAGDRPSVDTGSGAGGEAARATSLGAGRDLGSAEPVGVAEQCRGFWWPKEVIIRAE